MNKLISMILVPACCLLMLAGCRETPKFKIGVSQCSEDDWRTKLNDEIDREIMFHEDAEVEIRSANDDSRKQIEDLKYFVDNDFDIIIVSPNEAETLTPVIRDIYKKGMPVIIFDRNINDTTYTARIGADDVAIGRSAGNYARHLVGNHGNALEIYGLPGSTPAADRHKGFSEAFIGEGGNVLATVPANWNQEDAERVADSLLNIYKDVDLIYAHNDRMAIGASNVARRLGRDNIKIIGIDAAPEIGVKAVADGVIDATFLYPTEGQRLVQTALNVLKGEPYERNVLIPAYSAVDKTNADIILQQNDGISVETSKMGILKQEIDQYWEQHSLQTMLFYSAVAILVLLLFICFLLLRAYWWHKRHQELLVERNRQLQEERDKQKELNDKLQQATQSKLVFFTNVSHDLRTPLTLISEPVEQLAAAKNLTPQQKTLMHIADKNVKILQRLINQILDFRKYENGKLDLKLREFNLSQAVEDWTDSFKALAKKRDIRLALEVEPGEYVMALDAEKIERVFFNLVSNAFKYTPANGRITVYLGHEQDAVKIKVEDTGDGISERDLGNIFDRFFQVDRVHPNGSGIGLSLAKAFVELHGGSISVESTIKKGSVFTVVLPVRHIGEEQQNVNAHIPSNLVKAELDPIETEIEYDNEKPLLLVIDDNKDIQKLVGELLKERYNVISATNGKEGIRMANKYVPDLIVCDVMMPVMDGLECCRLLKAELTTSHVPVLMLTACSLDEQRVQGYDSGADGYLSKPFNSAVLKSRVASLIENRRRIKASWQNPQQAVAKKNTQQGDSKKLPSSEIDNEFYAKFLEIVKEELGNSEISVDEIAQRLGLGRSQFYRKIKALTNYSPVELLRRLRLEKARAMLLSTEKSISEIGYETGFSTPAYFTKCYREAYGKTPSEVRQDMH